MEEGERWLVDGVDQIVLGDQHHAQAVEALRNARGKSWSLLIEEETPEAADAENMSVSYSATLYSSIASSEDGQPIYRLARYLHNVAARWAEIASNARANYLFRALSGEEES